MNTKMPPLVQFEFHPASWEAAAAAEYFQEVLALDPCVTEASLRLDVAYKAETHFDELPYVMGLVRQSYERQMGQAGEA